MQEVVLEPENKRKKLSVILSFANSIAPTKKNLALSLVSSLLLIFSFPDFNLWFLAWFAFIPLFISISNPNQTSKQSFTVGWLFGTVFFLGTCYWLTYAMIHYGNIPTVFAYILLILAAIIIGLIPAFFSFVLHNLILRFEIKALLLAPFCWVAFEWLRFEITGQLWNAAGYSQAYMPSLIQTASWGSVYAVSFLIVLVNAAIAYSVLGKKMVHVASLCILIFCTFLIMFTSNKVKAVNQTLPQATVISIQPNVPMDSLSSEQMQQLFKLHIDLSETEIKKISKDEIQLPRLVIWPESPMLFLYTRDGQLRDEIADFTKRNKTSLIINSFEPAPNDGGYNSALFIGENGNLIRQYDKIHLMPFGEYVPVPRWIPGASYIPAMVGDFTAGNEYDLFRIGNLKAGVFICFESAFPNHTRKFANEGADVLIEMTNDGYLGPTPVLRQHLANAVFRAVETNRPVVRSTNAGITAFINERGEISDETKGFEATARTWKVYGRTEQAFYARYGDVFAYTCLIITALSFSFGLLNRKTKITN